MHGKFENLIGKRFGRLLVIEKLRYEKMTKKSIKWRCLCDCGKERIAFSNELNRGLCNKCFGSNCLLDFPPETLWQTIKTEYLNGFSLNFLCKKYTISRIQLIKLLEWCDVKIPNAFIQRDITGQRFGNFIAKKFVGSNYRGYTWECECDCGNIEIVSRCDLRTDRRFRCTECSISYNAKKMSTGYGDLTSNWIAKVKWGAKIRNLEYDVSNEYLWNLFLNQNKRCALTGLPIYFTGFGTKNRKIEQTASLDRIDNEKGYIEGNLWWVHKHINRMKNKYKLDYFKNLCKLVTDKDRSGITHITSV